MERRSDEGRLRAAASQDQDHHNHTTTENSRDMEIDTIINIEFNAEPTDSNLRNDAERDTQIDNLFQQAFEFYKETSPVDRIFIPRQKPSKKLAKIINYLNNITIPENVNAETEFHKLQTVIYCAAWTAAKANGAKIELTPRVMDEEKEEDLRKDGWIA
ncbi:hypothetical protein B5X24_HaOG215805 [Helicoverpa armigera]|nr:hypothetical protein B5X24_HaOG215805 [Helicoverpa armigera]